MSHATQYHTPHVWHCLTESRLGRFWTSLYDRIAPYPDQPSVDPTPTMIANNVTVRQMYEMADNFYTSMGLKVRLG